MLLLGMFLALVWWRRHPKASLLALLGLGAFFLLSLVMIAFWSLAWPMLVSSAMRSGESPEFLFHVVSPAVRAVYALVSAGLWGLILWAIFARRPPVPQPMRPLPDRDQPTEVWGPPPHKGPESGPSEDFTPSPYR
jgi:hypothetical protein